MLDIAVLSGALRPGRRLSVMSSNSVFRKNCATCEHKAFDVSEFSANFGKARPASRAPTPDTFLLRRPTFLGIRQEAQAALHLLYA